jgi:hypothetical protein
MKTQWTDPQVDRLLKSLKDEPTGDVFWKTRVWENIEKALPAEVRKRFGKPWYRRPSVVRLSLVAACMALALGWWRVQVSSTDSELADFISNISSVDNNVALMEAGANGKDAETRCGTNAGPVDSEDASLEMESLYDSL